MATENDDDRSRKRMLTVLAWAPAALAIASTPLVLLALAWLQADVESRFGEAFRQLPSRVYSRPLILRPGMSPERAGLREHLERAGYRPVAGPAAGPGEFAIGERKWMLAEARLSLDRRGRITAIRAEGRRPLEALEVEPAPIGAFFDTSAKDRDPVRLTEVPPQLIEAVLVVEDRSFFEHGGLDLRRIVGALLANWRAQRVVQGGSTLTQQLVKNVYLTRERTLARKLREALIAVMLERNHTKEEILEAYLNEVYLGQNGSVGIHGVGRAARHYFARSVGDLDLAQSALLVGILPGPSLYSPFRNPEAARKRRDFVLTQLFEQGRIDEPEHRAAIAAPLALGPQPAPDRSAAYFLDFLRRDLEARFPGELLESEGLAIYTTLDARLQRLADRALRLARRIDLLRDHRALGAERDLGLHLRREQLRVSQRPHDVVVARDHGGREDRHARHGTALEHPGVDGLGAGGELGIEERNLARLGIRVLGVRVLGHESLLGLSSGE